MGRVCFRYCLQLCLFALSSAGLSAAGTTVSEHPVVVPEGTYAVQALGYVVAILILAGAGVVVLFKGGFLGGLRTGGKSSKKLQIEETRMLGHRQYLIVAEYEGRRMLLGVCPGRIDYLCPLDSEMDASGEAVVFPLANSEPVK